MNATTFAKLVFRGFLTLICCLAVGQTAAQAARMTELTDQQEDKEKQLREDILAANRSLADYLQRGDYPRCITKSEEILKLRQQLYSKEKYPDGHNDLVTTFINLATFNYNVGSYNHSETYLLKALEMRESLYSKKQYPDGHAEIASSLNSLGVLCHTARKYEKAEEYYLRSMEMYERLYPKNTYPSGHLHIANSLRCLGLVAQLRKDFDKAIAYFEKAIAMQEKLFPKEKYPDGHAQLAATIHDLGYTYDIQYRDDKAELYLRRALEMREKLFPEGHPELATSIHNLAAVYKKQGKFDKAEPLYRQATIQLQKLYPKEKYPNGHPDLATSLINLGLLYSDQGSYTKAEPYYSQALLMFQQLFPKEKYPGGNLQYMKTVASLASLYYSIGQYGKAIVYLREALEMSEIIYPKSDYPEGHEVLALTLNNLAACFEAQGSYDEAETHYLRVLAMREKLNSEKKYPNGHSGMSATLSNLAGLYRNQGKYEKAEAYAIRALEVDQKLYAKQRYPSGHPNLAGSLGGIGELQLVRGDYEKAEISLRQALEMYQSLFPKEKYPSGHPSLATLLNTLGANYQAAGQYEKAEPYLRQALEMREKLYPRSDYPTGKISLAASFHSVGLFYQAQGKYAKAAPFLFEALEMYRQHLLQNTSTLAEAQLHQFSLTVPLTRDCFLSVTRRQTVSLDVYANLWHLRGSTVQLLQRRHMDTLASADPQVRRLQLELVDARQQLAHHLLLPVSDIEKHRARTKELTTVKEDLEKKLVVRLDLNPKRSQPLETTPEQLAKALPSDTAFVDLLQYTDFEQNLKVPGLKGETRTLRYVAFITLPGKKSVRVELCEAEAVKEAWTKWKSAIVNRKDDRDAAAKLAALVWKPLKEQLPADIKTVYFCADDLLSQIPWSALPGAKADTVLLEEYTFALVPHGSYLIEQFNAKATERKDTRILLTVGGVDYEQVPGAVDALERSAPPEGKKVVWPKLPGTAQEQELLLALAEKALGEKPLSRSGKEASAAQIVVDLPKSRYAHIATHGFFADEQFRSAMQIDVDAFKHLGGERKGAARSPLVLSGLVFAGANVTGEKAPVDRGILTAEGIIGLDLRKLELAVLSACDTGVAELGVGGGEGVYGLQRAFLVAGCPNVIASLWKVEDEATAALMGLFYRNLWVEKMPPAKALREAQLYLYRNPQQISGLARKRGPDFTEVELPKVTEDATLKGKRAATSQWAAFTFSGAGR